MHAVAHTGEGVASLTPEWKSCATPTAYLFFTGRAAGERAFEDRQTQVRDWYNYAVQQDSAAETHCSVRHLGTLKL